LLLLLRESRLEIFALLFDFAVLFEEFIEQHGVHLIRKNVSTSSTRL
jgi:5-methylcytosine-specific restriction endonuclease McrBC regulatory subunit McrC